MYDILQVYQFTALKYIEDDGAVTLSLNPIDLAENGKDEGNIKLTKVSKCYREIRPHILWKKF